MFQRGIKAIVVRKGYPEDLESVGGNLMKSGIVLVLDQLLEGADVLGSVDLDREDVAGIIAENYAVQRKRERHATSKLTMLLKTQSKTVPVAAMEYRLADGRILRQVLFC